MSLVNVLKKAMLSRVTGGLIIIDNKPLTKAQLEKLIDEVESKKCKAHTLYHLNDETCVLSKYQLDRVGKYHWTRSEPMSLNQVSKAQLRYEEACGANLKANRYRTVSIYSNSFLSDVGM